jgi:Flp pilus assembly pilin Flp
MNSVSSLRTRRSTSRRFGTDTGATAVEYALLVAGIALVMLVGVAFVGGRIGGGVAAAAEALSGTSTGLGNSVVTAPAQACAGRGIVNGRDTVAPTCNTTTGTWTCPQNYDLDRVSGRGTGSVYTCEED